MSDQFLMPGAPTARAKETDDERFMREAIALARLGTGTTRPNPMVGAVIARGEAILGRGWHERCGGPHAEVNAFARAREAGHSDFSGATLYVTLEPCCHFGRTPPCVDLVVASGVSRVVCGMVDPNPLVAGKGIRALEAAGLGVTVGTLERECRALNRGFIKVISGGGPYVILKSAISLDGKVATAGGDSRWISCDESRADVHLLRAECAAVMTGIGTALADDPLLTARYPEFPAAKPARVVVDTRLRVPLESRLVKTARDGEVIVACGIESLSRQDGPLPQRKVALENAGVTVLAIPERDGRVDLAALVRALGERGLSSILIEAGGTLAWGALDAGIVDRVRYYVAPIIVGGAEAPSAVGGRGAPSLGRALKLTGIETRAVGRDLVIEGDVCLPE